MFPLVKISPFYRCYERQLQLKVSAKLFSSTHFSLSLIHTIEDAIYSYIEFFLFYFLPLAPFETCTWIESSLIPFVLIHVFSIRKSSLVFSFFLCFSNLRSGRFIISVLSSLFDLKNKIY